MLFVYLGWAVVISLAYLIGWLAGKEGPRANRYSDSWDKRHPDDVRPPAR